MTTLHQFGDKSPPNATIETKISHPKDSHSTIGHIGFDEERDEYVAMLPRDTNEHYFRKFKGYAISLSILQYLEGDDVATVCIVETNGENRVIEFERQQFKSGEFVAYDSESNTIVESKSQFRNNKEKYDDPQHVLPVDDSLFIWEKSEVSLTK